MRRDALHQTIRRRSYAVHERIYRTYNSAGVGGWLFEHYAASGRNEAGGVTEDDGAATEWDRFSTLLPHGRGSVGLDGVGGW